MDQGDRYADRRQLPTGALQHPWICVDAGQNRFRTASSHFSQQRSGRVADVQEGCCFAQRERLHDAAREGRAPKPLDYLRRDVLATAELLLTIRHLSGLAKGAEAD